MEGGYQRPHRLPRRQGPGRGGTAGQANRVLPHWPDVWELRDDSLADTALRVLSGFHGDEEAVVLDGDNKEGNWVESYLMAAPTADDRYDQFLRRKERGQQR